MNTEHKLKTTPLHQLQADQGAKFVAFGDWKLPAFFSTVKKEHQSVRESCGVFDVSHMGEILVSGPSAESFLNRLLTNDVSRLQLNASQYTAMLNEQGGFVDDLIVYRLQDQRYLLCVNAANIEKDFQWLQSKVETAAEDLTLVDASQGCCQLAIQGPKSKEEVIRVLVDELQLFSKEAIEGLGYGSCVAALEEAGDEHLSVGESVGTLLARTGYTGEKGYELYTGAQTAMKVWQCLTAPGGITRPIGLGARDTLRLEAGYLLYGQDMDGSTTPFEAQIRWAVKMDKPDFIGKDTLVRQTDKASLNKQLRAFHLSDPGIPRAGMKIYDAAGAEVGVVSSGSYLPTLGKAGGLAYCKPEVKLGDNIQVDVRGKLKKACVVKKPLYQARIHD